jgi:hypothetical protein
VVAKRRGHNLDTLLVKGSSPKIRIIQLKPGAILYDAADLTRAIDSLLRKGGEVHEFGQL